MLIILSLLSLLSNQTWGYSIHSGLTDGCHERITRRALQRVLPKITPPKSITVPSSKTWRKLANVLLRDSELNKLSPDMSDHLRLVLVSLLIGVRSPDTEGHAVTNLSSLRQIHADPSAEGQYAHALRGPDDDGAQGDENAVNGTREAIIDLIRATVASVNQKSSKDQIITVQLYFDFYGLVDIEVWEPAYIIGRSLHALQDSFAHTIRSDDLKRIRHVLNYVDAIAGDLKESVDGLPHSAFMDRCDGDTEMIAETATLASENLIEAINKSLVMKDVKPIMDTLDEWVTYEPGCTISNDYCNSMWVTLARQEPTGPYLEEFIGCDTTTHRVSSIGCILAIVLILLSIMRRVPHQVYLVFMIVCVYSHDGVANSFVQSELHASLLSDSPDRSTLANTYGWGLRGGYTWGDWSALIHVEQNVWLTTELTDRTTDGVLNVGGGAAYNYGNHFIRTSLVVGSSTLLFDTIFDETGTTGLFLDIRPIEMRWAPLSWLRLNLTPFSFTFVAPVLEEPSIKIVLYRTVFGTEFIF